MQLDLGCGVLAVFDHALKAAPLRQRLEWCLNDLKDTVEEPNHEGWKWILKPSVTNKGLCKHAYVNNI
jgi:hypothetical protein